MKVATAACCVVVALSAMCVVDAIYYTPTLTILERTLAQNEQTFQVFFKAYIEAEHDDVDNNQPLKFGDVVNNKGSRYNARSGVFTAPVTGQYVFILHLADGYGVGSRAVRIIIESGGETLCTARLDSDLGNHTAYCMHNEQLRSGQTVNARLAEGQMFLQGCRRNSFAGYLMENEEE